MLYGDYSIMKNLRYNLSVNVGKLVKHVLKIFGKSATALRIEKIIHEKDVDDKFERIAHKKIAI